MSKKTDIPKNSWEENDAARVRRHENEDRDVRSRQRDRREDAARDLSLLRGKLEDSTAGHARRAASLVVAHPGRMPNDVYRQYLGEARGVALTLADAKRLKRQEQQLRKSAAKVLNEPGPYDAGSPSSWVCDVIAAREPVSAPNQQRMMGGSDVSRDAVLGRLNQHQADIRRALVKGSKYGRRAEEILSQQGERTDDEHAHETRARTAIEEARAFGTAGGITATSPGEAASFVPPAIVLKSWSYFRTPFASFAKECTQEELPPVGLNVYVQHVTGELEVTSQTEGSAVAEKMPTAGLIKGAVVNKAGQLKVSQQLLDRAGPGISGDQFLFGQLKWQLDTALDEYAINQALLEAQTVTNAEATFKFSETSGVGGFLGDVRKGKNLLATTAGTRLKASHIFAPSKFVNYLEAFATTTGGPVWTPELDGNQKGTEGDPHSEGYTAYVLAECKVCQDDNLPLTGTVNQYQVLVARPETILVFKSTPVFYCWPATYANTLDAALGARVYVAVIPRWPEGIATLTGAFYKTSTFV
jgi:hypothetical protein